MTTNAPFLQPGESVTWKSGATVQCMMLNASLVGFDPNGEPVYSTLIGPAWDLYVGGQSATGAMPQGVHKGGGVNVSPAGEVLVTAAQGIDMDAIPGKGTDNDVWLLDLADLTRTRRILAGRGAANDVWARIWPGGRIGSDGHFDEFVVGELLKPALLGGAFPFGSWVLSRYRMDGTLIARYGQSWTPGLLEPYGYVRGGAQIVFASPSTANWLTGTIRTIDLTTPGASPQVLVPTAKNYQEFAAQCADEFYLYGNANSSLALEVWQAAADGSTPKRVTYFNTLLPPSKRQTTQIVPSPTDPLVFWVSVQESDVMHLNTYRVTRP